VRGFRCSYEDLTSARMPNTWFPTIAELEAYDEQRRREERIDDLIGSFLTQLRLTTELPLVELARPANGGGPDPKSVIVVALD